MWVRDLEYSDTTMRAVLFLLVVDNKCTNNCWKLFHAAHLPTKSRQKSKVSFLFSTQRMNSLSFTNRPRTLTRPDAYYFLTILHILLYVLYFPGFICISRGWCPKFATGSIITILCFMSFLWNQLIYEHVKHPKMAF